MNFSAITLHNIGYDGDIADFISTFGGSDGGGGVCTKDTKLGEEGEGPHVNFHPGYLSCLSNFVIFHIFLSVNGVGYQNYSPPPPPPLPQVMSLVISNNFIGQSTIVGLS